MKKRIMNIGILCLGLVLSVLFPVIGTDGAQGATKHLTIGAVQPVSGPISIVGIGMGRGYELFFDKVNEEGGIKVGKDRYLVDFKLEDGKSTSEASGTAATKLIQHDGAIFVFGAILENATAAIYQVSKPAGALHMISWVNITGHPADVSPEKPLLFRPTISPHDAQVPLLDLLKQEYPHVKTMVISAPNIGYEPMIELLKINAKERGLEVIAVEKWEWGIEDFVPIALKAIAPKPDIFYAMMSAQSQYQLRAARELGFKGVFLADGANDANIYIDVAGKATTDVLCAGLDPGHLTKEMLEIKARWEKKYKDKYVLFSAMAYSQAWTLVQAIEKADSIDPEKVLATLEGMKNPGDLRSAFGSAYVGGEKIFKTNRVLARPIPISHIVNGKTKTMSLVLPDID